MTKRSGSTIMGPFRTLALLVASLLLASCTGSAGGTVRVDGKE
ncbi:MAG: hypothetical protein AABZ75_00945 [candidate division NC10 bacterium]|jgi:hypothetical protein